jgi:hypothetical protein
VLLIFLVGVGAGANENPPSPSRGTGEPCLQLQTLGRRTNHIRLSSTAGTPNILLRTIGNTVLKAHMASTWARTQLTLMLCLLGAWQTLRGPMYWNRGSSVRRSMCIAAAVGAYLCCMSRPPILADVGIRASALTPFGDSTFKFR